MASFLPRDEAEEERRDSGESKNGNPALGLSPPCPFHQLGGNWLTTTATRGIALGEKSSSTFGGRRLLGLRPHHTASSPAGRDSL